MSGELYSDKVSAMYDQGHFFLFYIVQALSLNHMLASKIFAFSKTFLLGTFCCNQIFILIVFLQMSPVYFGEEEKLERISMCILDHYFIKFNRRIWPPTSNLCWQIIQIKEINWTGPNIVVPLSSFHLPLITLFGTTISSHQLVQFYIKNRTSSVSK